MEQPIRFIRQFINEFYLRLRIGNFLRYLFSTYEHPPWDVIERRKSFPKAAEAVEYVIRALVEYAAKIEIAAKLRREASEAETFAILVEHGSALFIEAILP